MEEIIRERLCMRSFSRILPALIFACAAYSAMAQTPGVPTNSPVAGQAGSSLMLTPEQLSGGQQMNEEDKAKMLESMQNMTPEEREKAGEDEFNKMTPEQKSQMHDLIAHPMSNMTPEQRNELWGGTLQKIKDKYDNSSPEEQARMRGLAALWKQNQNTTTGANGIPPQIDVAPQGQR
jgi:hypothetical protein